MRRAFDRGDARRLAFVVAVTVGVLALFLDKAFTVDDPLFLWLGRHLQREPLDFFGFDVNWNGMAAPMYRVTRNPPLAGYYIAAAAGLVGWSEVALHAAFLLPASAAAAGTFLLARRCCDRPLEASLIAVLTPVFLVSSSTVMSDTLMLALWCAALWCWITGLDAERPAWLFAGAVLAALAGLAKYFGLSVVPLMVVYAALRRGRPSSWIFFALLPVAATLGYELWTRSLYGVGLLSGSADYAEAFVDEGAAARLRQAFVGLVFAGGCLAPALLFAPLLWRRAVHGVGAVFVVGCVAFSPGLVAFAGFPAESAAGAAAGTAVQLGLFALGGASLLGLVACELRERRDPESGLLALWVLGTFVFAAFLNWTNNGRSNLPMAPALGILIARRLSGLAARGREPQRRRVGLALGASAAVALATLWADVQWANDVRSAARDLSRWYVGGDGETWFQGHWGFQYYMEAGGARAVDFRRDQIRRGDLVIVPDFNYGQQPTPRALLSDEVSLTPERWVATMSRKLGAAFYGSNRVGPLPFAFGRRESDVYRVWRAEADVRYDLDFLRERVRRWMRRRADSER